MVLIPRSARRAGLVTSCLIALSACASVDAARDRMSIKLGGEGTVAEKPAEGTSLIHRIQSALVARGYEAGRINGRLNGRTEAAIQDFQLDHDLPIDGRPSDALLEAILAEPVPPA